jgi:hypothetical protein
VLGRLAKLVRSFDADLGPLPLLEQEYLRAYKAARDSATAVIKAADALSKRATSPEAAAAAAARVLAAAGARKPDADVMPDVLLDDANDEFNRFFEQVDIELLGKMAESFGGVADASTARVETAYSALQASMDRHQAKELRDAMMLRSLRRIAEGGGEGGAPVPVLAAILKKEESPFPPRAPHAFCCQCSLFAPSRREVSSPHAFCCQCCSLFAPSRREVSSTLIPRRPPRQQQQQQQRRRSRTP